MKTKLRSEQIYDWQTKIIYLYKKYLVVSFAISASNLFLPPSLLCPLIFQAIKFLLEKELLNDTPEDVALYLFCNGMDKTALGDYLGEG